MNECGNLSFFYYIHHVNHSLYFMITHGYLLIDMWNKMKKYKKIKMMSLIELQKIKCQNKSGHVSVGI